MQLGYKRIIFPFYFSFLWNDIDLILNIIDSDCQTMNSISHWIKSAIPAQVKHSNFLLWQMMK